MHKFTRESLLALSNEKINSNREKTQAKRVVILERAHICDSNQNTLTWSIDQSYDLIDQIFDILQQMKHNTIKASLVKTLFSLLNSTSDYLQIRSNGFVKTITSIVYKDNDPQILREFGKIYLLLANEKENIHQFDSNYIVMLHQMLELDDLESNKLGIGVLLKLINFKILPFKELTLKELQNIEKCLFMSCNWSAFVSLMKEFPRNVSMISSNALIQIIKYEKDFTFVLDSIHINNQLAFDKELLNTLTNSISSDLNSEQKDLIFATICNILKINSSFVENMIQDKVFLLQLENELNGSSSKYVSMIWAFLMINRNCSLIHKNVVIENLQNWLSQVKNNKELKNCLTSLISQLK